MFQKGNSGTCQQHTAWSDSDFRASLRFYHWQREGKLSLLIFSTLL